MGDEEKLIPRNYQVELMKIALKQNTIIYLPTGAGKTYIAILVLKQMSESLKQPYNEGGKITLILVNTVALVAQHAKYVKQHTIFKVGTYSGEMNLDFWSKEKWNSEFNKFQVIIMTSQILLNNLCSNFIDLTKINLIIFDECHHGVDDHSMRQIMKGFQQYDSTPRVIGLTATLLNRNCKLSSVMDEVRNLEITYHSKVATIDELEHIIGHSTNPKEEFEFFEDYVCSEIDQLVLTNLNKLIENLNCFKLDTTTIQKQQVPNAQLIKTTDNLKKLINLIKDLYNQMIVLGTFGGYKACIAYLIQIERLLLFCQDVELYNIFKYVETEIGWCAEKLKNSMNNYNYKDKLYKFSSEKLLKLIHIFKIYKDVSNEDLCAIIFTQKRFTAKILFHILQYLSKYDNDFNNIRSNFIVGFNCNPYNNTREHLFISKKNKEIIDSFINKEINVLVSSNVLEEGVDIPKCTLVIKFDKSLDYRSYIQSKGRARHKLSLYYTLVENENKSKFMRKIEEYRAIENNLNDFLIGKNLERLEPSENEINDMYNEEFIKPYFTNGPNSAQVNMLSAIPLLCQYCSSLLGDKYTVHAPDWYIEKKADVKTMYRVIILLPMACPIIDPIYGPFSTNKKIAKRAAALNTCIALHKYGELNDDLLPVRNIENIEGSNFLFKHWPEVIEKDSGYSKKKRLHKKQIPNCLKGKITSNKTVYLHIIELKPNYARSNDINQSVMYDMYSSNLCFGFITPNPLPNLCNFPIYDSNGSIQVEIKMNVNTLTLTKDELLDLQKFHFLIFDELLEIIKSFLTFDNEGDSSEMILVVPIQRNNNSSVHIDYDVIKNNRRLKNKFNEPSIQERSNIHVTEETYLHKIISPWYRSGSPMYIVTRVILEKNPLSNFPNDDYENFIDYYAERHKLKILNSKQPLLLVKPLSERLNLIKPRGLDHKKRKLKKYEEVEEYLIPELLIKQNFPASLWIQSKCLPTILSRITFLLKIEQLQKQISIQGNFNINSVTNNKSLELDEHLLNYLPLNDEPKLNNTLLNDGNNQLLALDDSSFISKQTYNKDFTKKMLESEYPWRNIDEPKDIDRQLNVSIMDIVHYTKFVTQKVLPDDRMIKNQLSPNKQLPAITYNKDYTEQSIDILLKQFNGHENCPNLNELYEAFTTAKSNDIVNLERLETLGDSFLKYISSVYIILRFPKYNEGSATALKGKLVSNKNLYYLAVEKNFCGIIRNNEFQPKSDWLPSCYHVPDLIRNKIINKELPISKLFNFDIPIEEQISGTISKSTIKMFNESINDDDDIVQNDDDNAYSSMADFLNCQYVADKAIADSVEALLGSFITSSGISGGIKLCEWLHIIPNTENLQNLLNTPSPNPIINKNNCNANIIDFHLPQWQEFENRLGYHFNNRAYLLQALTHSTYTPNRITYSYERLEFLGDAVLDFLITCHIYESCGKLNPGQVTDLRSALVNNNTFASLVVRCGLHKFLLMINVQLQNFIDKFADYLEMKNYVIDDEVLILLEEDDLNIAEYVDVPKILGDVFEALAGAVYLDSGKNLQTVWKVFHRIMWREIELFSNNVPKNVLRRLYECHTCYPVFSDDVHKVSAGKVMISLEFMCDGRKKRVHGFGSNKNMAKRAAAKIALRALDK